MVSAGERSDSRYVDIPIRSEADSLRLGGGCRGAIGGFVSEAVRRRPGGSTVNSGLDDPLRIAGAVQGISRDINCPVVVKSDRRGIGVTRVLPSTTNGCPGCTVVGALTDNP